MTVDKLTAIVEKFDKNLSLKGSAHEIKELWAHCAATYADKSTQEGFVQQIDDSMKKASEDIAAKIAQFYAKMDALQKHIKIELKNAKAALQPSAFDEG